MFFADTQAPRQHSWLPPPLLPGATTAQWGHPSRRALNLLLAVHSHGATACPLPLHLLIGSLAVIAFWKQRKPMSIRRVSRRHRIPRGRFYLWRFFFPFMHKKPCTFTTSRAPYIYVTNLNSLLGLWLQLSAITQVLIFSTGDSLH